jgi:hypothetical protein
MLLARAGRGRSDLEGLLGFLLLEATGRDEAAEGVGGAVEDVGEAGAFGDLAAGLDRREEPGEEPLGAPAAATGGKNSLLGAGRERWERAGVRCGPAPG